MTSPHDNQNTAPKIAVIRARWHADIVDRAASSFVSHLLCQAPMKSHSCVSDWRGGVGLMQSSPALWLSMGVSIDMISWPVR